MTSFNNKRKTALAFEDCGHHDEPMYRRVVFRIIEKLNSDVKRRCTSTQRDLVLQSLGLICTHAPSPELENAIDDILTFLKRAFQELFSNIVTPVDEKLNLKMIIHLADVLAHKSKYVRAKMEKRKMFQTFIDIIFWNSSFEQSEGDDLVSALAGLTLHSQVTFELLLDIKTALTSVSSHLLDSDTSRDARVIACHLSRLTDINSVLFDCRTAIRLLIHQQYFTTEHKIQFKATKFISQMMSSDSLPLPSNLSLCSHQLKIIVLLGDLPILREVLLHDHASELIALFLATLRCEEDNVQDLLTKFWLVQRFCENSLFRNFIFRAEGAILEIMAVMRAVQLEAGEALSILSPFCHNALFLDMSLTTAQVIAHFGMFFQSGESDLIRRQAGDVLVVFTEGLESSKYSKYSAAISSSFIESGILFSLTNVISGENCASEWASRGTDLLCALVEDKDLRQEFLSESLGILHCLVTSLDSFEERSAVFMSLIAVLEVVACDPHSHPRLFESEIVLDLSEHIKHTLSTDAVDDSIKVEYVLHSLNIFDIIASSEESCFVFKQMQLDVFLGLLLQHERGEVRAVVTRLMDKLGSSTSPIKWKTLFQKATKLF
jgi:hypothetical protein